MHQEVQQELEQCKSPLKVEPLELAESEIVSYKSKPPMTTEENNKVLLFLVLFTLLGLPIGLNGSIQLMLAANHASPAQLALFLVCLYPFTFKLIIAPFVDSFYSNQFGKRKTYIIPCLYMIGMMFMVFGFSSISTWIADLDVYPIVVLNFFMMLLTATAFIAMHGWVLTSFSKHYVHLGGTCQHIGTAIGSLFAFTILLNITSVDFCRDTLGLAGQLVTLEQCCMTFGLVIVATTIVVQVMAKEVTNQEDDEQAGCIKFRSVISSLYELLQNDNMKFLILFLLTKRFGFAPVLSSISMNLIQQGFPETAFATVGLFMYPGIFGSSYLVGRYLKRGCEMTWLLYAFLSFFGITGAYYLYVQNFLAMGGYNSTTYWLFVLLMLIQDTVHTFSACSMTGFIMRISDPSIGGSYATLLACSSNLGMQVANSVSMYLLNFISYRVLVICGWIYAAIYFAVVRDKVMSLQYFELSSWRIRK